MAEKWGRPQGAAAHCKTRAVSESVLPPHPPAHPIELIRVDRSHRAVLENLGPLYRHDLSESYQQPPNLDGTFNNRRLDLFLAQADPQPRAWLIIVSGR